jgi:hypothetical protein
VFSFFDCFLKGLVLIKTFGIQEADTLHKLAQRELDEETVGWWGQGERQLDFPWTVAATPSTCPLF